MGHTISFYEDKSIGTHSIRFCANGDNITHFDSFEFDIIEKKKQSS